MRIVLHRSVARIVVLMLALALLPTPTHAQDPAPPVPTAADDQPASGTALLPNAAQPTVTTGEAAPTATPIATITADRAATVAPATTADNQAATRAVTRVTNPSFDIKVEAINTVPAGGLVTYTYTIKNQSSAAAADAVLQAWWNDRDTGYNLMTCTWPSGPTLCVPINVKVNGVAATATKQDCASLQPANSLCYLLPTIPAGQTAEISLQLRAQNSIFPQTNRSITTLAGSGRVVRNANRTQADSEDKTSNTMVVGPVITGVKTAVKPASDSVRGRIYTGDEGTFNFVVGNATSDGDKSGGVTRPDARPATNIVVTDQVPAGSSFVGATGGGALNQAGTAVVWNIPGPLNPGDKITFSVTFKKLGQSYDRGQCAVLSNSSWNVTSAEYPTGPEGKYYIGFSGADIPVIPPVYLQAVSYTPNPIFFGERTRVTITVRNYWPEAVNNATLTYSLQKNADFDSSNATAGGALQDQNRSYKWTFNMPAGGMDTPKDVTFSIDLIGRFDTDTGDLGIAQFDTTGTSNLSTRWDCPKTSPYPATIRPRLYIRKYTDSTNPRGDNAYLVSRNSEFEYAIDVKNYGSAGGATNVTVKDYFPTATGANFSYVAGSATGPAQPTVRPDGTGLTWIIPSIPAGQTVTLRYRLAVKGDDYVRYCNFAEARGSNDEVVPTDQGGNQVCVKINPDIRVTKTVDRKVINLDPDQNDDQSRANRTVRFTMTIKNNEPTAYMANLADDMGYLIFKNEVPVGAPAIDAGTPSLVRDNFYVWPLVTLQPGETRTAVFDAEVPNICNTANFVNKALFQNSQYFINPVPEVTAAVQVNCGRVNYEISSDRTTVSLRDKIIFTLKLSNNGTSDAANLPVENRMPSGFSFVSMESDSTIKDLPTQAISNTYTTLRWTVPKVAAGQSVYIKYRATSGDAVIQGSQNAEGAWLRLMQNGRCSGTCIGDAVGGPPYSVNNVRVEPLATLEPKIAESGCAKAGDTRSYTLSIVNRNSHAYAANVVVTLPFGLSYSKALGATAEPSVVQDGNLQRLVWGNQTIAAPQSGQSFVQNDYSVELKVGNSFGALRVISAVNSPDGSIPRKEGVVDPTVFVCIDKPLLTVTADRSLVKPGGVVAIQITLVNPLTTPYSISIKNQLAAELGYLGYDGGQGGKEPTVSGSTLTWNDLVVPATVGTQYGVVVLNFRVKLSSSAMLGQAFDSVVTVLTKTPDTPPIDASQNKITVRASTDLFIPMVSQKR